MPDTLYRSHSLEKITSDGQVITSGSITTWEDNPVSSFDVGDTFSPVPDGPILTVKKVNINDNVIGTVAGKTVRQWQISIEGDNANYVSSSDTSESERHNFAIELNDDDSITHSGSLSFTKEGTEPPANLAVGDFISIPGIGNVKCTKVTGSSDYKDDGTRVWTMTYECTDTTSESSQEAETLTQTKYSFFIDSGHSGSMQVVNEGNSPAITLAVGATFSIPGIGEVTCSKISGSDDYTDSGQRRWTVTYEGSNASQYEHDTKYTFTLEASGDTEIISGTKQAIAYGDSPTFTHRVGDTFIIPGAGSVTCTKVNGADEFLEDGRHKWTLTYDGTNDLSEGEPQEESLPNEKYNITIENDSDGVRRESGSKVVVNVGDSPFLDINVGSKFNIPGIGEVICSKVSGSDDYTDSGQRRWTMTYEGYINEASSGDDKPQSTSDTKYHFAIEKDSSGNLVHSGTIEITTDSSDPTFQVGDNINIQGIGKVKCVKVSGSDSYTENGRRKWVMVYEGSDSTDSTSGDTHQEVSTKYSFDIEKNSDGVTVYSGTKEFSSSEVNASPGISLGEAFICGFAGTLTCTKIRASEDNSGIWTFVIEGTRSSGSSQGDDPQGDSSLPDDELSLSYELNGTTVYTVSGKFIALRRSTNPILKKSITVYTEDVTPVATIGSSYQGGIALSENIIKETIRNNGVVTGSYYKHTIEVEAESSSSSTESSSESTGD